MEYKLYIFETEGGPTILLAPEGQKPGDRLVYVDTVAGVWDGAARLNELLAAAEADQASLY